MEQATCASWLGLKPSRELPNQWMPDPEFDSFFPVVDLALDQRGPRVPILRRMVFAKKEISLGLILFLLFAFDCGADASLDDPSQQKFRDSLNEAETAWVLSHEALTYVYDPDWAPFEWKTEDGAHVGIVADLFSLLRRNSGLKLAPRHTDTWSESVALVRQGEADMFSAITVTDERKQYLNFSSRDIYSYPAVLVTQFDDDTVYIDIEKDARHKTIAIVRDSGLGRYIQHTHPDLNYVEVPSTGAGFTAVLDGDADLFAINTITAKYVIEKQYLGEVKIATKLDYIYHLKIAVRNDRAPEFISVIDKALGTVSDTERNAIFERWTRVEKATGPDWEMVAKASSLLLIILFFLAWHNIKLKKQVNRRTRELANLANTDSLTGAKNRRKLDTDYLREMKRADRNRHKMAMLYIDLDDFKKVNDAYGHQFGDRLLNKVSVEMLKSLRDAENLYRLGGDEFCIILPEVSSRDEVAHVADRLSSLIAAIREIDDKPVEIGCSVGVAIYPEDGKTLDELMGVADKEMYRAKAARSSD